MGCSKVSKERFNRDQTNNDKKNEKVRWNLVLSLSTVFREHFEKFDSQPNFDLTVLVSLEQLPIRTGYDLLPSDEEIVRATS